MESRNGTDEKYDLESIPLQYSTRKFVAMMEGLGLGDDLIRAKEGRKIRAGKATMRGRNIGLQRVYFWLFQRKKDYIKQPKMFQE